jgi:hypothetical protein
MGADKRAKGAPAGWAVGLPHGLRAVAVTLLVVSATGCGDGVRAARDPVLTVSNRVTLAAAIAAAAPGTTIRVAPGRYGRLELQNRRYPGRPLTITAAGGGRPEFEGADLTNAEGLVLSGLKFASGEHPVVKMAGTRDAVLAGNVVTGATGDQDPWTDNNSAIHLRGGGHVTIFGNLFEDLRGTMFIQRSDRVTFARNTVRTMREGLNVAASTDLSIDGNLFHSFSPNYPNREHADAIQFWTSRETSGSSNVRIEDNVLLFGGCKSVQGIFIRSESEGRKDGGPQIRHDDFTIRRNLYYGSSRNGLSVSSVDRALVENNVIVASPYGLSGTKREDVTDPRCSGALVPGILSRFGSEGHVFRRNVTNVLGQTVGTANDNLSISRDRGNADWTDVFAAQPTAEMPDPREFLTRPGSKAYRRGIGLGEIRPHGVPEDAASILPEALKRHAAVPAS